MKLNVVFGFGLLAATLAQPECRLVSVDGSKGTSCECTTSHCDRIEPIGILADGEVAVYATVKDTNERLTRSDAKMFSRDESKFVKDRRVILQHDQHFQTMVGFGGAFTDAAGICLDTLPESLQDEVMEAYFGPSGIEYSVARVPMASCDFSERVYSYDDVDGDFAMAHFSLQPEDFDLKMKYIHRAREVATRDIKLFGSPWSAPAWMKQNEDMQGGQMKEGDEYYEAWRAYFVKFLEAYRDEGLPMWAVSVQNEPTSPKKYQWQSMHTTAEREFDFVERFLGPALADLREEKGYDVKLIVHDDQRLHLPERIEDELSRPEVNKYVDGIGIHWYAAVEDTFDMFGNVAETHHLFPDKFIIGTEACTGYLPWSHGPKFGDWRRGMLYAYDIIYDTLNYAGGWVDWNLVLDLAGGPNWAGNEVDAPIMIDTEHGDRFYKQPMYYFMGHFTKFVPPGSVRIGLDGDYDPLHVVAFQTPEDQTVVVVLNYDWNSSFDFQIWDGAQAISAVMEPASCRTFVFNSPSSQQAKLTALAQ